MHNGASKTITFDDALSVYVHWPYCARICPYCDFNVYKNKSDLALLPAILKDLTSWRAWSGPRPIRSLHFGGGTPSLMTARDIQAIIDHVEGLWGFKKGPEIGLEANPLNATREAWKDIKKAGINRISLGIQTFHDPALKLLGRDHDSIKAKEALALSAEIFDNFSADLIFGWAGQTAKHLQTDLETVLAYNPPHLSAYQLTIEDGTAFGIAEKRGLKRALGEEDSAEFYETVTQTLTALNYDHYEVSNFAKPAMPSQHNLGYWEGQDYVGVGPGAHGRLTEGTLTNGGTRIATISAMKPNAYTTCVSKTGFGIKDKTALSPEEASDEYLLMGLRISSGISLIRYRSIGGTLNEGALNDFIKEGYLIQNHDRLYASPKGRPVLNYLTHALLT